MGSFDKGASGIRSIQRGSVASAGNVTINRVNPNKTVVISSGKGSAGTVAASGSISGSIGGATTGSAGSTTGGQSGSISATISGGTTTGLYAGQYSAKLIDAVTLSADGACDYQVIEYV